MEFTAAQDGLRVDVFLAGCLPELTRSAVQRLLAEGSVTCGGAPVRKNAAVPKEDTPGDVFRHGQKRFGVENFHRKRVDFYRDAPYN